MFSAIRDGSASAIQNMRVSLGAGFGPKAVLRRLRRAGVPVS